MTVMSDDKRRPASFRSKTTKSMKGQRTLFDMLSKNVDSAHSETPIQLSSTQLEAPGPNATEGTNVIVDPTIAPNSPNPLLLAPKPKSTETPASQDRSDSQSTLTDGTFIQFDDSDMDVFPIPLHSQTSSQGSKDTPIVIDSSPTRPFAPRSNEGEAATPKPRKPLHPFFVPRAKTQHSNARTTPRSHQTRGLDPIYPDQESQHVKGNQSSYPCIPCPFERRIATPSSGSVEQHLRDDRTPLLGFLIAHEQNDAFQDEAILPVTEQPPNDDDDISSINEIHVSAHPAIARVVGATASDATTTTTPSSSTQLWTDVWRPRHAKEVLGNEQSAVYLRNWLHTLALQFYPTPQENEPNKRKRKKTKKKKRPRIVREVPRKKPRRNGLDDWIVEDGEEEEEEEEEYITASQDFDSFPFSEFGEEGFSAYASADIPEPINEQLHNTILLAGPPGCGKTAAVYACAEELGWEVFEVYPGIGRRNGANVDNLVGDVGKNHLVRKKQGATGQPSIATLLSGGAGPSVTGGEDQSDTSAATSSLEAQQNLGGDTEGCSFRQSLILLEEVDLLFKDDVNFWPAVTHFIKDCRRPVICTCNDASLVPTDGLPLQKVLYFEPCAPNIATSYLQGLARAEGHIIPPERIRELYSDTYRLAGTDIPSDTGPTTAHVELPNFDLRKAIHELQMWCTTGIGSQYRTDPDRDVLLGDTFGWPFDFLQDQLLSTGGEMGVERERNIRRLDGISLQGELLSYLDGCVLLPLSGRKEALVNGNMEATPDDENGHAILYGSSERYEIAMQDFHDRDMEICWSAIRLARGRVTARGQTFIDVDGDGGYLRWALFRRRMEYQRQIGGIGWQSGGIGIGAREDEVYTEYLPYIREMVKQAGEMGEGEGRMTRNSQRTRRWECVTLLGMAGRQALTGGLWI